MSVMMLAECEIAVDQSGLHGWKYGRPQVLLPQKHVDRAGRRRSLKHTLGRLPIHRVSPQHPSILPAAALPR